MRISPSLTAVAVASAMAAGPQPALAAAGLQPLDEQALSAVHAQGLPLAPTGLAPEAWVQVLAAAGAPGAGAGVDAPDAVRQLERQLAQQQALAGSDGLRQGLAQSRTQLAVAAFAPALFLPVLGLPLFGLPVLAGLNGLNGLNGNSSNSNSNGSSKKP